MVEGTCLESRHTFTGIGGSNPPLSAIHSLKNFLAYFLRYLFDMLRSYLGQRDSAKTWKHILEIEAYDLLVEGQAKRRGNDRALYKGGIVNKMLIARFCD